MSNEVEKRVYTATEAAEVLDVSEKTITRMLVRGDLQRIQAIRTIRIPIESVEKLISSTLDYNPTGVGLAVQEKRICHISNAGVRTGGHRSPMQTAKELENLLEQPIVKRQKH